MTRDSFQDLKRCVQANDIAAVREWLEKNRSRISASDANSGEALRQLFAAVQTCGMADLLFSHGADAAMVSDWWAPGFGLQNVPGVVAEHFLELGAILTPHAAAALGLVERLRGLLDRQSDLVHAKGGDGCRPLHFSRDVATARLLLDRGAELDPTDDDHDSTPAQWRIGDAPDVTRFLLDRSARPDVFMAGALGDLEMAEKLVIANPACTTYRIGNNSGPFPGIGFRGRGGTIYQWTLDFNRSPQEIARLRGHREVFAFLIEHTPPRQQLLIACMLADRPWATEIAARFPNLIAELDNEDKALLAKCCWETNLNREAVRLMLDLGFPIDVPESNHGYQALHNAAWCGDPELVTLLLQRGHPVDGRDPRFQSTALGFAIHSCMVAKRHPEGNFPQVVQLLLEAGTPLDEGQYPTGDEAMDAVIRSHRKTAA